MKKNISVSIATTTLVLVFGVNSAQAVSFDTNAAQAMTQSNTNFDWMSLILGQSKTTPDLGSIFQSSMKFEPSMGLKLGGPGSAFNPFNQDGSINFKKSAEIYSLASSIINQPAANKDSSKDLSMDAWLGLINNKINTTAAGDTTAKSQKAEEVSKVVFDDSFKTFSAAEQLVFSITPATSSLEASNNANEIAKQYTKALTRNGAIAIQAVDQQKIANQQQAIELNMALARDRKEEGKDKIASMERQGLQQNVDNSRMISEAMTK